MCQVRCGWDPYGTGVVVITACLLGPTLRWKFQAATTRAALEKYRMQSDLQQLACKKEGRSRSMVEKTQKSRSWLSHFAQEFIGSTSGLDNFHDYTFLTRSLGFWDIWFLNRVTVSDTVWFSGLRSCLSHISWMKRPRIYAHGMHVCLQRVILQIFLWEPRSMLSLTEKRTLSKPTSAQCHNTEPVPNPNLIQQK